MFKSNDGKHFSYVYTYMCVCTYAATWKEKSVVLRVTTQSGDQEICICACVSTWNNLEVD